jgi:ribosomal protein L37E
MLAAGVPPTHWCEMCGHHGFEDPAIGCLRCGWDEMRRIDEPDTTQPGSGQGEGNG